VKHKFEVLLSDYLNNLLECDDFIDVNRDDEDPLPTIKEEVKCLFANSSTINTCKVANVDGQEWSCKGKESCTVTVVGEE